MATDVDQDTGGVAGTIAVPDIAPAGSFRLELSCSSQGQRLGGDETPFTVVANDEERTG
jgi:hypothetical protein